MNRYQVLSPDGFSIDGTKPLFTSLKKARQAFEQWKQGYKTQGYYSQTCYNGYIRQIPLEDLENYCQIVKID